MMRMLLLYFAAAAVIAWGIARDLSRGETWMIGFGKVIRRSQPTTFWLTILLRGFLFVIIIVAAYLRNQA